MLEENNEHDPAVMQLPILNNQVEMANGNHLAVFFQGAEPDYPPPPSPPRNVIVGPNQIAANELVERILPVKKNILKIV